MCYFGWAVVVVVVAVIKYVTLIPLHKSCCTIWLALVFSPFQFFHNFLAIFFTIWLFIVFHLDLCVINKVMNVTMCAMKSFEKVFEFVVLLGCGIIWMIELFQYAIHHLQKVNWNLFIRRVYAFTWVGVCAIMCAVFTEKWLRCKNVRYMVFWSLYFWGLWVDWKWVCCHLQHTGKKTHICSGISHCTCTERKREGKRLKQQR